MKSLKMPCLWIRGENSVDLTAEEFKKIQSANSDIQAVEIPGAGHWVHFDKPAEFIEVFWRLWAETRHGR